MANYWAKAAHQITLLTFDDKNTPHYHVPESIQWHALNIASQSNSWIDGLINNLKRIQVLRKFILQSEPDCVISFMSSTNILVLLATRFLSCKVLISERNYPKHNKKNRKTWFWLRKTLYPLADHLVVQTDSIKEYFRSYNGSVQVIPNPVKVDPESLYNKPEVLLPTCNKLVAMGSMTTQKGFDLLIEVFANLYRHHSDWNLIILGEGVLGNELKSRARELHIENAVFFAGRVENPFSIMSRCDLFVLSSRYEGFPNALLEAMARGRSRSLCLRGGDDVDSGHGRFGSAGGRIQALYETQSTSGSQFRQERYHRDPEEKSRLRRHGCCQSGDLPAESHW